MSKKTKEPLDQCIKWFNKLTLRQMRTMIIYGEAKIKCEQALVEREGPWVTPRSFVSFVDEFKPMTAKHKKEVSEHILKRDK